MQPQAVLLSVLIAFVVPAVLSELPTLWLLPTAHRALGDNLYPDPSDRRPRLALELIPFFGIYWKWRVAPILDGWLRRRGAQDEPTLRLLRQRKLRSSAIVRILQPMALLACVLPILGGARLETNEAGDDFTFLGNVAIIAGVVFVALFLFDLWLAITYRRALVRKLEVSPLEDNRLVTVDERYNCIITAVVRAPREEVEDACWTWGRDLGWHQHRQQDRLSFSVYRWYVPDSEYLPDVMVTLEEDDDKDEDENRGSVTVTFEVPPAPFRYLCQVSTRKRMCENFARGVCSDLARRGFPVSPVELGSPVRDRAADKDATARWRLIYRVTGGLCLFWLAVGGVLIWLYSYRNWGAALAPALPFLLAWLCLAVLFAGNLAKERRIGMSGISPRMLLWTFGVLWVAGLASAVLLVAFGEVPLL